jgi:Mn-dependent DtxR family transcriptional regulator
MRTTRWYSASHWDEGLMVKRKRNPRHSTGINRNERPNPLSDLTRVEDYLEVVYALIHRKGYARPSDIAEQLDVRTASVTGMLHRLDRMGLIVYERYRGLTLTPEGEELARNIQHTHLTILKFLRVFGIEEKVAKEDAEGIEHHVSKSTLERFRKFVEFIDNHPSWFRTFVETLK